MRFPPRSALAAATSLASFKFFHAIKKRLNLQQSKRKFKSERKPFSEGSLTTSLEAAFRVERILCFLILFSSLCFERLCHSLLRHVFGSPLSKENAVI